MPADEPAPIESEAGPEPAAEPDEVAVDVPEVKPVVELEEPAEVEEHVELERAAVEEAPAVEAAPVEEAPVEEASAVEAPVEPASPPPLPSPAAARSDSLLDDEDLFPTTRVDFDVALSIRALTKRYGSTTAVDAIDLEIPAGSFFGIVGPNGAGKTTTLSMATGLLRPDSGTVAVYGADVWSDPVSAKRRMGVLPDRLRLFDRLTGAQLLRYAGSLRGLDRATIDRRSRDLAEAFGLTTSLRRLVSDYSAGMTKKMALAAAMIHAPRLLVLDEPFESVDPVSTATVIRILDKFVAAGGTVVMSSHSMGLVERVCDSVAVIAQGKVLAAGPIQDVLRGASLEDRFVELAGGATAVEGMEWLHSYSD